MGVLAGPVFGLIDLPRYEASVLTLEASGVLLAISLMAVALRFPLSDYRAVLRPVGVLLTVAMAGMAVVNAGLAWLVLGLPVVLAALLGACVTPTDPVLASGVVSGGPAQRQLPARRRQVISGESGANDGLAFAFAVLALGAVTSGSAGGPLREAAWGAWWSARRLVTPRAVPSWRLRLGRTSTGAPY